MNEKSTVCDSACDNSHIGGFSGGSMPAEETPVSSGIVNVVSAPENDENFHSFTESGKYYMCALCGKKFPERAMWNKHHFLIHKAKNRAPEKFSIKIHQETSVASNSSGSTFFQPVAELKNVESLRRLREPFYECGLCGEKFLTRGILKRHHSFIHEAKNCAPNMHQETFVGSDFPEAISKRDVLRYMLALSQPPIKCEVCEIEFECRKTLERHSRIHKVKNCKRFARLRSRTNRVPYFRTPKDESGSCDVCERPVLRKAVREDNFTSAGKQIRCADCKKTFDFEITIK